MAPRVQHLLAAGCALAAWAAPAAAQGQAPTIDAPSVVKNSATSVVFSAAVDPNGEATTVQLAFGETRAVAGRSSVVDVGAGTEPVLVRITLSGQPDTRYFWRFEATNAAGTTLTDIDRVRTPKRSAPRVKVLPPVRTSFAVRTRGGARGELLGFTRPRGLPKGTRVTVRCHAGCRGGRSVRIPSSTAREVLVRLRSSIPIDRRSVVDVRATRTGSVGRLRRYVFRRSQGVLIARRVLDRCLVKGSAKPVRCRSAR